MLTHGTSGSIRVKPPETEGVCMRRGREHMTFKGFKKLVFQSQEVVTLYYQPRERKQMPT